MGENTNIEWTDATYNPWYGCKKISAGCSRCYCYREMKRYGLNPSIITRSKTTFRNPLKWKEPRMIFVCSWSDFFIKKADEWRDEAWDVIRKTPQHIYQILTKRPENIWDRLPKDWPWENVWLGVTCENQKMANERIPILSNIPATIRFISYEPLLEYVKWDYNDFPIDWIIIGAESGPKARLMKESWVRRMLIDAKEFDIPVFYKQKMVDGKKVSLPLLDGKSYAEFPKNINIEEFQKKESKDDLRITDWIKPQQTFESGYAKIIKKNRIAKIGEQFVGLANRTKIFTTQYGKITGKKWLEKEGERLIKLGIETEIVPDGKMIALARKSEKVKDRETEF